MKPTLTSTRTLHLPTMSTRSYYILRSNPPPLVVANSPFHIILHQNSEPNTDPQQGSRELRYAVTSRSVSELEHRVLALITTVASQLLGG